MEHRWGSRHSLEIPVRLEGLPISLAPAKLRNVSSSGAYLETKAAPALDSRVMMELECRLTGAPDSRCRVQAYVVRRDERGVGVEWCEFAPRHVLELIAAAWQTETFGVGEDRPVSQALPIARKMKAAARAEGWSGPPAAVRHAAAARL